MKFIVLLAFVLAIVAEHRYREHQKELLFTQCVLAVLREIYCHEKITSFSWSSLSYFAEDAIRLCQVKDRSKYPNWSETCSDDMASIFEMSDPDFRSFAYLCALKYVRRNLCDDDEDRMNIEAHCNCLLSTKKAFLS